MTSFYGIAGRVLCVEASNARAARVVGSFFRDFHIELLPAEAATSRAYHIRVHSEEQVPSPPASLEVFDVAYGKCYPDADGYYLAVEGSMILVCSEQNEGIDLWIGASTAARNSLALSNVFAYVLDAALRRCGLFQLHGSGVVAPGFSDGMLIVGESGSGKSTLATLLTSRGWSYLTDDALLLSWDDDEIRARGMRTFFAASEKTLAACGISNLNPALGGPINSDPSKRRLEPTIAFPGLARQSCIPRVIVFSSIVSAPQTTLVRLTQREAMAQFIRFNPWASYDKVTAREHLGVLNQLAKQCRSFFIRAGQDILREPTRAEDMLMPLMQD